VRQQRPCNCEVLFAGARLEIFAQGMAADCTEEQFDEYLREAQLVAEQIVQSVLQD
jgi:hypothetical protein